MLSTEEIFISMRALRPVTPSDLGCCTLTIRIEEILFALLRPAPSHVTDRCFHASPIQQDYLRPAGRKLGLGGVGWHTFRHTYRSWLDDIGAPIGVQQKLMRHAQPSTTLTYGNALMKRSGMRTARSFAWRFARLSKRWLDEHLQSTKKAARGSLFAVSDGRESYWTLIGPSTRNSQYP
jgi:hypothetical protein